MIHALRNYYYQIHVWLITNNIIANNLIANNLLPLNNDC